MSEAIDENDEAKRSIAADYHEVFSTPQGRRVLAHMLSKVLRVEDRLRGRPIEWAPYMMAMNDAANDITAILNFSFDQRRPAIAQRPPRSPFHKRTD